MHTYPFYPLVYGYKLLVRDTCIRLNVSGVNAALVARPKEGKTMCCSYSVPVENYDLYCTAKRITITYVSGLVAEVLDGVGVDRRRAMTWICPPRQPCRRLRHVGYGRLRWRSRERGWLRGPVENDGRVGGRLHNQCSTPGRLSCLTGCLTRVPASVRFTKI